MQKWVAGQKSPGDGKLKTCPGTKCSKDITAPQLVRDSKRESTRKNAEFQHSE
jgi:hypothetical protein